MVSRGGRAGVVAGIERELVLLARWLEAAQRRQHYPMDRAAYLLLLRLESEGPSRVAALAAALGLDGSTVTRQVAALEDRRWVTRSIDPDDARATVITATKAGLAAMNELRQYRRGRVESLFADWSGTERAELARVLAHLNEVLERNALAPAARTPAQDRAAATQNRRQRPPTAAR